MGPGCVKTCTSLECPELFSQLPSSDRSCQCKLVSTATKSRWKFYAQVGRRSFHTVWVKMRRTQWSKCPSGLPPKADIAPYSQHVSNVPKPAVLNRLGHVPPAASMSA